MKLIVLLFAPLVAAFAPVVKHARVATTLQATRREALVTGAALFGLAAPVQAYSDQAGIGSDRSFANDREVIAAQQATSGKVDLNSAFVNDYMQFPGMYPSAAGKIASNGPYDSVQDLYKIKGLTANDKKLFKKYENEFTVLPASARTFNERINARVST